MQQDEQARLIFESGPTQGRIVSLASLPVVFGRSANADVVIESNHVSRRHAQVRQQDDLYLIEDLGSSNGTFVNDRRLEAGQSVPLQDGDQISFGQAVQLVTVIPRVENIQPTIIGPAPGEMATVIGPPVQEPEVAGLAAKQGPETQSSESFDPSMTVVSAHAEAADADRGMMTQISAAPAALRQLAHPPQLVVTVAGTSPQVYTLINDVIAIGRAENNDIPISSPFVSRQHARLTRSDRGYDLHPLPDATNPIRLDGQPVSERIPLKDGATLRIGGNNPGEMVTLVYLSPDEAAADEMSRTIAFEERSQITIGRDASNDITLEDPTVSRYHAQIERVGQRYRLKDLRSSNGTFVNDVAVDEDTWLKADDAIRIGPYRFVLGADQLTQYDESKGMRIEAIGLNKWVRKDLNILQDVSLVFERREFVVVVGQSGGGKSTLVDAISGYRQATDGKVLANDIDIYHHFDAIRNNIGYVPQKDIIHMELTVFEALDYAAQMRMPADTTEQERHARVKEVMDDLDLAHRQDVQIRGLSGGQQKRVSIGVELLTKPNLFFLDEPTSGLDPGTETALMQLMRRLADQGRTIVLITHATKNVMLADKVVFLARGGYLAWFGPPDEALAFFDTYRSERDQRAKEIEFDDIYNLLDDPAKGTAAEWAERYRKHPAYNAYITEPLADRAPAEAQPTGSEVVPTTSKKRKQVSALRQFMVLSARNIKILTRDRASLLLMLLTAPLISFLDFVLVTSMSANLFDFWDGNINNVVVSATVMLNDAIMVGGLSQMRELVKERDIYRRERMVNLRLFPYIWSKIWVAVLLAIYQAAVFVAVRYIAFDMPGGAAEVIFLYITIFLAAFAGMSLGLFASALAPNSNTAPLLLILFLIPQLVLSGGIVPLPPAMTAPASSRWAFQSYMTLTGTGADVAADACWDLPDEERNLLTSEQKEAHCLCLGENALREDSCNFPGLGEYYDESIDQPDPEEPSVIRDEPAPLVLPPEPERPADQNDPVALQQYLAALTQYNTEVGQQRQAFEADMAAYRTERQLYELKYATYQTELSELGVRRATAVGSAETAIKAFNDDFGWSLVNKDDNAQYYSTLLTTWAAQLVIILVLLTGTVLMQKRWDV